ncbi:membrane protein insertase YidC [Candidatus Microgenomates bacterium]|nr:membrane protein insertase YidC [Candidatus Microgenomates bacterium]
MGDLWNAILYQPLLTALIWLYNILFHNFGLAVIALTIIIRAVLVPITIPALKSAKKMMELKPHLDALKEKHGNDKQRLQQEQLRLYKEHGFNPLAGCLPYLVQFLVLIALYQVFINFLNNGQVNGLTINKVFLGIDLSKPDRTFILPLLAGATQLILSLMMMPSAASKNVLLKGPEEKVTTEKKAKEEDMQESMQKQMLFLMPAMTVFFGFSLPSGLALYWVVTTVFSVVQQYFVTGLGGLRPLLVRLKIVS